MKQEAIDELVRERRLRKVPPNAQVARRIWGKIAKDLSTARHLISIDADRAHECAYDAAFKAVVAILRAMGYRLGNVNQRQAAVEGLRAILDDPNQKALVESFDEMRAKRNRVSYEAGEASETEAKQAVEDGEKLVGTLKAPFEASAGPLAGPP